MSRTWGDTYRHPPGTPCRLAKSDTAGLPPSPLAKEAQKAAAKVRLAELTRLLAEQQERLYASNSWSILIIFQALDAGGKDSAIEHIFSGINPQGVSVTSFKRPSEEELGHTFLWRCVSALPRRGMIGVFNRSYYEEVLVVKVHPQLLDAQHLPHADPDEADFWNDRYEDINNLERHLVRNGTKVVKFYLNLSRDEQRRRLLDRLDEPDKHWKFDAQDLAERARWDDYRDAYESMIGATSTEEAPWHIIPADHKWFARQSIAEILLEEMRSLNLQWPTLSPGQEQALAEAKRQLLDEDGPAGR